LSFPAGVIGPVKSVVEADCTGTNKVIGLKLISGELGVDCGADLSGGTSTLTTKKIESSSGFDSLECDQGDVVKGLKFYGSELRFLCDSAGSSYGDDDDKDSSSKTGPAGPVGPAGVAATIRVGTVTTVASNIDAGVANSGSSSAAVFNFTIPRGATGSQGSKGDKGDTGLQGPTGISGAGYSGVTSDSNLTIGTGSRTFTITAGSAFATGQRVRAASTASPTNYMEGIVTISGTSMTMTSDAIGGSGNFRAWTISTAGNVGAPGATGSQGPAGPAGPSTPTGYTAFDVCYDDGEFKILEKSSSSCSGKKYKMLLDSTP